LSNYSQRKSFEYYQNLLLQIYNDRNASADFTLRNKQKPADESYQVHLFVLVARSEYYRGLIDTPMLEVQKMEGTFESPPSGCSKNLFKEFIKYLYFDEVYFQDKLNIEEILYLCELCDFYGLSN